MRMRPFARLTAAVGVGAVMGGTLLAGTAGTAVADCGIVINGHPVTATDCAVLARIYGEVEPGRYFLYTDGTWVNADDPEHRGNLYADAERAFAGIGRGYARDRETAAAGAR